jgi:hypothetical protein
VPLSKYEIKYVPAALTVDKNVALTLVVAAALTA